ncbi:MAG: glycosyl transferase family 2, partial [Spirochaetota bacterium]
AAKGELLLFFDADVIIDNTFVSTILDEFHDRYYELATNTFVPDSELNLDKLIFKLANQIMEMSQYIHPLAPGFSILCTRRLFYRVGGFDESLYLAEDHDFVKKGSRWGRFGIITGKPLKVSIRRFEKEGRLNLVRKYIFAEMYRIYKGRIEDDTFSYDFAKYDETGDLSDLERKLEQFLALFEKKK